MLGRAEGAGCVSGMVRIGVEGALREGEPAIGDVGPEAGWSLLRLRSRRSLLVSPELERCWRGGEGPPLPNGIGPDMSGLEASWADCDAFCPIESVRLKF